MIKKSVNDLKGGEVLAGDVVWDHKVILPEGCVLKNEYIDILRELGVTSVSIMDESVENDKEEIDRYNQWEHMLKDVSEVLGRHMYIHDQNRLQILRNVVDEIIETYEHVTDFTLKEKYLEARTRDLYEHSFSVCCLSISVALKMNLEKQFIKELGLGCLLHDIGIRCMENDYISMDVENMEEHVIKEYHKHPVYGCSMFLQDKSLPEVTTNVILHHHERLDGSGYPMQLKELSLESRIVAVCEVFDEMISGIACNKRSATEAVKYLEENKGKLFDERIVDLFLEFVELDDKAQKLCI